MAQNLRSVSVVFQAFTDKFEKSVDKAGGKITGFGKKVVGAFAGFIAAKATLSAFSNQLSKLDRLGKLSDRLEIDPNTLRGLDLAATQMGTSFEVVDKGIQRMARTIGEAREGITTGTTALRELGLTVSDFDGMTIEQQFLSIADKIAAIQDPTRKAAVAFKIFGRQGQEMLNLLSQGSEGIKKFVEEAKELGGPISRDDLKQVEMANDAVDKMGRAWEGIIQQLAIEFAPLLQDMAEAMKELIGWVKEFGKAWKSVQGEIEDVITMLFFDGEGIDVKLGARDVTPTAPPIQKEVAQQIAKPVEVNLKSFVDAAQAQSSRAFDILNPNRSTSVHSKIEKNTKETADAVQKLADQPGVKFIQEEIK